MSEYHDFFKNYMHQLTASAFIGLVVGVSIGALIKKPIYVGSLGAGIAMGKSSLDYQAKLNQIINQEKRKNPAPLSKLLQNNLS
jgi:uncharacterized membrane-anchored protein YhcB (DUF1043 family)